MIALCPNHHDRYDKGQIDRKAIFQYKANLSVLNGRYSDLERRVLQALADRNATPGQGIVLPGGMEILMMHLVEDGIVTRREYGQVAFRIEGRDFPAYVGYTLTSRGCDFIGRWLDAGPLLEG